MRFAIIDNNRSEAQSGLKGICPACGQPVIAKCGTIRIHHWAHLKEKMCDPWWDKETEWHRSWKNCYPEDWQEVIKRDEKTGEPHIADICTSHNLVIEFQHSPINSTERISRESFYKTMVWVVDGLKDKLTYKRFQKWKDYGYPLKPSVYRIAHPYIYFPVQWLDSSVPVVFDFGMDDGNLGSEEYGHKLYCLFPHHEGRTILAEITKKAFIKYTFNGLWQSRVVAGLEELYQM